MVDRTLERLRRRGPYRWPCPERDDTRLGACERDSSGTRKKVYDVSDNDQG